MSIFKKIGNFFVGLFNAAKKTFNELNPQAKDALLTGTGIVDILNNTVGQAPEKVRAQLLLRFPHLPLPELETGISSLLKQFGLKAGTMEEGISLVQAKLQALKQSDSKMWAVTSHSAATLISVLYAPAETKVASVVSLIEYVYQHFVKKSVE